MSETPTAIETKNETPAPVEASSRPNVWRWPWSWRRFVLVAIGAVFLGELSFLAWIWPDWDAIHRGQVPESTLIQDYKDKREDDPKLPRLQWIPLPRALPNSVKKAFILSEDSRFYEHGGVDFQAIQDAMEYNWKHGKILLGASTISQQTAKNMFLSLSRNPLRKFHELFLTWLLEYKLSKAEILHVYLNVAEFGLGIYGIEAAARHYYHVSAYNLSPSQAAELAASLPSPKKHNPRTRTRFFTRHVARLSRTLQIADQYAAQQGKTGTASSGIISPELAKKLLELRELNRDEGETSPPETTPAATPEVSPTPTAEVPSTETTAGSPQVEKPAADVPETTPKETPEAEPDQDEDSYILE